MSVIDNLKFRIKRALRTQRILAGIQDGSRAFIGPDLIVLDITNICRNTCLACWIHSPFLDGEVDSDPVFRKQLPIDVLERVIADISKLGVLHVILSGGGNVFLHPQFDRVVTLLKNAGIMVTINANFVDCRPEQARMIVDSGVEAVVASVWAASADVYLKTHPDKKEADFHRMTEMLKITSRMREYGGQLTLFNVIMNENYHELEAMVHYAADVGASQVDFCLVDPIPGKTDCLLLNDKELSETRRQVALIEKQIEIFAKRGLQLKDFDLFQSRISSKTADCGEYNPELQQYNGCHIGWQFLRINADGSVNSCLKSWRYPLGNVNEDSVITIWNNAIQQDFRQKSQSFSSNREFFAKIGNNPHTDEIGCFRSCDNQGVVTDTREMWLRMPLWRKKLARILTPYYKITTCC